ncbi:ABC transporter ATP-binding protein [Halarsenatibacter silvermanii]|uniref:Peptide/nickel transport system ATP-binding protein n=1 Tax=Halarsenatibacter silvermanii TaxID=321763 RepID=A0A1G9KFS3_9FIRM|nr:ABC transporter ATP-binding protein [Halarsenatibacter silvermanii]SDL48436.1 peptide/nickel transport system ATP-binding protein [Halarsenatibacter silvermanii]
MTELRKQTDKQTVLEVEDLHTYFEIKKWGFLHEGYVRAVDGVDLEIEEGESVSLVGESGCGKSSLAKTILGIHSPREGKIKFRGKILDFDDEEIMKSYQGKTGFVQQDPYSALPPFMSIQRILEEPMIVNGIKDRSERISRIERVMQELKLTPTGDYLGKFPHMLSGGQQQRVVLARSLVLNPDLLLADEPVSMLDASVRVEILELIEKIQKERDLAVIYITHDLSTVRYFSSRILVMYGGMIVEKSPVVKLLKNPAHPYTMALLEAISEPDAANAERLKEVPPGEPPSLMDPPAGCRFHPRCRYLIDEVCRTEIPPEFEISQERSVSCWLYREGRQPEDVEL